MPPQKILKSRSSKMQFPSILGIKWWADRGRICIGPNSKGGHRPPMPLPWIRPLVYDVSRLYQLNKCRCTSFRINFMTCNLCSFENLKLFQIEYIQCFLKLSFDTFCLQIACCAPTVLLACRNFFLGCRVLAGIFFGTFFLCRNFFLGIVTPPPNISNDPPLTTKHMCTPGDISDSMSVCGYGWPYLAINLKSFGSMDGWMNGSIGRMNGWMDERMNGLMDAYQTYVLHH